MIDSVSKGESGAGSAEQTQESVLLRLGDLAIELGAERVAKNTRALAERVSEGRFYVACVGHFKRGKSTLLNALLGEALLPSGVVPVTTVPTVVRYGSPRRARVRLRGGDWVEISPTAIDEYVCEEKNPDNERGADGLEVFVPSPLLATGMCLVDTPGLGSVFEGNSTATRAFIPHIDAALVVIGADPPLSGEELQLVNSLVLQVRDLFFVLNKADRTSDAERAQAAEFARRILHERCGLTAQTIYEVSAWERLEKRGSDRDWRKLEDALVHLSCASARSLVREAADRGLQGAVQQLSGALRETRQALTRPLEETERKLEKLQEVLNRAYRMLQELGVLLTAEQQRLSERLSARRAAFVSPMRDVLRGELGEHLAAVRNRRRGPAFRRQLTQLSQEIVRTHLMPLLEEEGRYADREFHLTESHFGELATDLLRSLAATGIPGVATLSIAPEAESKPIAVPHFRFHMIERVASPASPVLLIEDFVRGWVGPAGGIVRDAEDFLCQLLEVNTSRIQAEVEELVRCRRRALEFDIKALLEETAVVAYGALSSAKAAHAQGAAGVAAALTRIDRIEREVLGLLDPR